MAQQELNLLEVPTGFAAELGAGPPHSVGEKIFMVETVARSAYVIHVAITPV